MGSFDKKVSVVIPAYNTAPYLEKCVESVCAQTYPKELLEVIIVDDGSTDDTPVIAQMLAKKHENVRFAHQANGGSSSARNHGIALSTGSYIGFVDSDDYIDPRMYETIVKLMEKTGAKIAQASRDEIDEDGSLLPNVVWPPVKPCVQTSETFLKSLLMHSGDASFCTKLTERGLLSGKEPFPVGMLNEDFYLLFHLLGETDKVALTPERYYHVYYRKGSNSRAAAGTDHFPKSYTDIVKGADAVESFVAKRFPELSGYAVRFALVQRLDYLLHIPISRMTTENRFYNAVVDYLRSHRADIRTNPYLNKKQRQYLTIMARSPKLARKVHRELMRIRGQ